MELNGSQTEKNLKMALAGESIARNKYTYFEDQARKSGEPELADLYERLARNESTHARLWYTALYGNIPGNLENLKQAVSGEFEEWSNMYPACAKTAREEGFDDLAVMFEHVASIEKDHEKQFLEAMIQLSKKIRAAEKTDATVTVEEKLAEQVKEAVEEESIHVDKRDTVAYRCQFCGAVYGQRLDVCPVCQAINSWELCKG